MVGIPRVCREAYIQGGRYTQGVERHTRLYTTLCTTLEAYQAIYHPMYTRRYTLGGIYAVGTPLSIPWVGIYPALASQDPRLVYIPSFSLSGP